MGRVLVRWNDDHDKELLLWIVYCCTESGLKIPFDKVAYYMGPNFTEGAIVQHLAKVRTKMEETGLHPPPAPKRGVTARAPSSIYRKSKSTNQTAQPRRANQDVEVELEDDIDEDAASATRSSRPTQARRSAAATRSSRVKKEPSIKQEPIPEDDLERDPDGDYEQPSGRKRISSGRLGMPSRSKRVKTTAQTDANPYISSEWNQQNAMMQHLNQATHIDQSSAEPFSLGNFGNDEDRLPGSVIRTRDNRPGRVQEVHSEDEEEPELHFKSGTNPSSNAEEVFSPKMYQTFTQDEFAQQRTPSAPVHHGFDNSFNGFDFQNSFGTGMPPSSDATFNPYPIQVNQYAQGHPESASRVQSMSSATSFQSPDIVSPWKSHVKNEQALSFNAFGPYSTGPDMGYNTDSAFIFGDDGITSITSQDHGTFADAAAGTDFGVAENSANEPSYGLPPSHGTDLIYDPALYFDFGTE